MRPRRPGTRRRGAVAVLVTLCLVPLIYVLALVLDGGILMGRRRQTQAGADATAHAAAYSLHVDYATNHGTDLQGRARVVALAIASDNGFTNDGTTSTVTVNIPPTSGHFSGVAGYAEAIVRYKQKRYFSAILGSGTMTVYARAVARASDAAPSAGSTAYSTASILVLDPSAAGALTLSGGAKVTAYGGVQVNSNNSGAMGAVSESGAAVLTSPSIKITGNYSASGGSSFSSPPQTGQAVVPDPFASLASPSSSGMTARTVPSTGSPIALSPGNYSGGINLSGSMVATMAPGTYFVHGGLTVSGGASLSGTGVTILLDTSGGLNFSGSGVVSLSPSTSGAYAGMLVYQDRTNSTQMTISGGASMNMTGTIYAANSKATISGGTTSSLFGSQFVVKQMNVSGNALINTVSSGPSTNVATYSTPSTAAASAIVE